MHTRYSIDQLNALDSSIFTRVVGPIFEHSPWIAESSAKNRPFNDLDALLKNLCNIVRNSSHEQQLSLIRAHPDLVGRMVLTSESTREQAAAGLNHLSAHEVTLFQKQNAAYRDKFGFPFVICARLNKKDAIIKGFEIRLQNSPEQEIQTALEEIFKIAELRLRDLIEG